MIKRTKLPLKRRWRVEGDSLTKGEKCSHGNWDAIKELNYNGHWYRSLGC